MQEVQTSKRLHVPVYFSVQDESHTWCVLRNLQATEAMNKYTNMKEYTQNVNAETHAIGE